MQPSSDALAADGRARPLPSFAAATLGFMGSTIALTSLLVLLSAL
jgi:hypothetical protein